MARTVSGTARIFRAIFAGVALLAPLPGLAADPRPPAISIVVASRGLVRETAVVAGTLVAREEVLVNPQVDNLAMIAIMAEEGDRVTRGQVLARLARDTVDASLAQNAAQIARADAAIVQARGTITEMEASRTEADAAFARTKNLITTGAASRETYDIREAAAQTAVARRDSSAAALQVAEADAAFARAQRQELLVRLSHTDIVAPVAGIVSRRTARVGAVVGMAGDPLFRIISDGAIEVEGDVPESILGRLRPGQLARVTAAADVLRDGSVRLVAPEVSRATRLGRVRIAVGPGDGALTIGGYARATIETARHEGTRVPASAVQFTADGPNVDVVRDGIVEVRPVSVGVRGDTYAEITEGIAEGECVVAIAAAFVRNGDRVEAVPFAAAKPGE